MVILNNYVTSRTFGLFTVLRSHKTCMYASRSFRFVRTNVVSAYHTVKCQYCLSASCLPTVIVNCHCWLSSPSIAIDGLAYGTRPVLARSTWNSGRRGDDEGRREAIICSTTIANQLATRAQPLGNQTRRQLMARQYVRGLLIVYSSACTHAPARDCLE